jgi:energy-coupling factor transporter ATP-binding protein EcfA2
MQPLTRVATLLDTVPTIEPHPEHPASELRPARFEGKIEFKDVDFTYPSERQKQVLRQLSFEVEPRTKVALVGKAGCGKSTSVTLLQRFYNCNAGEKTVFFSDLYMNVIFLPRQARDKYRENSQTDRFLRLDYARRTPDPRLRRAASAAPHRRRQSGQYPLQ